jgi:hypothetical protein
MNTTKHTPPVLQQACQAIGMESRYTWNGLLWKAIPKINGIIILKMNPNPYFYIRQDPPV